MRECIDAMEDLYLREGGNIGAQPLRYVTHVDSDSVILTMPAYSRRLERFAVKMVTEYKKNPSRYSLPVQGGVTVLMDSENSKVLASLDSPTITALRTGAVSGLASKYLSRRDSKSVAVIGSGQQARTILEAVSCVREVDRVKVFSRTHGNAVQFAKEMGRLLGIEVKATEERATAMKNADILIVATNSSTPVIDWNEVPKGAHINSVGTLPDRRELDVETVCNSSLYVDIKEGVLKEAGDVIEAIKSGRITETHILGDLTDLAKKQVEGRASDKEVTLFKSVGFALQDIYASDRVYRKSSRDS